jgi:HAD superfamily hydrolase (TIGR01662 family)
MIAPIDVVLLDLGNTLFYDNAAAWPKVYARAEGALWRVLHRSGVKVDPARVYGNSDTLLGHYYALRGTDVWEPGTFQVLRDLLRPHAPGISDAPITRALHAMYRVTQSNWKVEKHAAPVLRSLKRRGFRIGAVSNGSDDWNALELLNRARLRGYFDLVLTSAAHGRRKPDATIFQAALDHFRADAQRTVMIGDSYEADILGASALGLHTIWITRRVASPTMTPTVEADATLGTIREVPAVLG